MTNWQYYLVTPALAAQLVIKCCALYECDKCPIKADGVDCQDYKGLRAWMESEME